MIITTKVAFKAPGIKEVATAEILVVTKIDFIFFVNIITNSIYIYYVKISNRVSIDKYIRYLIYWVNPIRNIIIRIDTL